MWQQTKSSIDSDVDKECQQDLGDSGFISGNILTSELVGSEVISELESKNQPCEPTPDVAPEPMRAPDTGVDLGLSESLSQLSLKHDTLNSLNKVHTEPSQLTPVSAKVVNPSVKTSLVNPEDKNQVQYVPQEPWEIYYTQDDDGDTQLHIAVVQGFVEAAICLVNMAPHPCLYDILNDEGHTALHLSVLTQQPRVTRYLILAGANPAARNVRGNTALHLACACGDLACAKALTDPLSPGERNLFPPGKLVPALPQNLEQRNYNGEMCIHIAAAGNHVELMRLLLRLGADLDGREGLAGRTALHLSVEYGSKSVLNFLLHECRPHLDVTNYAGITAYQIALCVDTQMAMDLANSGASTEPLSETDESGSEDTDSEEDEAFQHQLSSRFSKTSISAVTA